MQVLWMDQMRTSAVAIVVLLALGATAGPAAGQTGGPYDLTWNTIDGGGTTSLGGIYRIRGTPGQPDASVMSGGAFTLKGGFWGRPARRAGDVDIDGDVDIFDVIDVIMAFGTVPGDPAWNANCDFDEDGDVDIFDVIDTITNFGTMT